ncbi:hypothetical protein PC120_g2255 [Phytophthora cactorum]|nr:hypothetical protein PC120_g2255 [Phytophthora cactorum]
MAEGMFSTCAVLRGTSCNAEGGHPRAQYEQPFLINLGLSSPHALHVV